MHNTAAGALIFHHHYATRTFNLYSFDDVDVKSERNPEISLQQRHSPRKKSGTSRVMSTTDSREGKEDTLPIRIVPAMMAPSSPSNQSTLSALAIIACVALHPVLAAPAFPTDRVLFNRQPYYLTPNTQRGGRTTKTAGRSALGLQDIALNDQLTRGLNVHGGGLGGRIPGAASGAPFNIRHNAAAKNDDDSATTDSLGLQLSEEISRCVGTTTAAPQSAHLSTRGGSTEAAPLPDEEQTSAVVDTAAKSSKEVDEPNNAAQYAKKLKNRNRTNIKRKILHCSFGLFFAGLHHVIPRSRFIPGMTILTSATLFMELMRYRKGFGWMNDALHFVLGDQLRKHEMEGKFTGSFYYFFGVTMTAYLFPKSAASLGIAQLAIADPSASFFGRHTRHIYWSRIEGGLGGIGRNKGVLGFLGGALFCFPYNYRVLSLAKWAGGSIPGGKQSLLIASMALGLAGAFADLAVPTPAVVMPNKILGVKVPPFHIDDNFVVPIFSGWACTKIFGLLGWPLDLELGEYILF